MEGYFKHKIGEKEIEFFIGNYSLERTLEELDASLSEIGDLLNKKFMPTIRLFMFFSAEYQALKTGQDFTYTKFQVFEWIDQTGGTEGEFYIKFTREFMRALGLSSKDKEETPKAEKKSLKVKPKK